MDEEEEEEEETAKTHKEKKEKISKKEQHQRERERERPNQQFDFCRLPTFVHFCRLPFFRPLFSSSSCGVEFPASAVSSCLCAVCRCFFFICLCCLSSRCHCLLCSVVLFQFLCLLFECVECFQFVGCIPRSSFLSPRRLLSLLPAPCSRSLQRLCIATARRISFPGRKSNS